jgi:hypothetical protein
MATSRNTILLRSVEDLADAKDLRAAVSAVLHEVPLNDTTLRCAIWSFVGNERRAGVPPAVVITRLTTLIDEAKVSPVTARLGLTRRVILWAVEEYFGHLGGDVLAIERCHDLAPSGARS